MTAESRSAKCPSVGLESLDELWFQVAGTRCNLECSHCFISCSPTNDKFGHLSLETVRSQLEDSVRHGVREYYFTGGEPFLNKELVPILELTLKYGPATVLTNATFLKPEWIARLRNAEDASDYCLEFRVSIDGPDSATNDPIRGAGTFDKAVQGVALLVEYGFLPIITMTRVWNEGDDQKILGQFRKVLADCGYGRARLKIIPRLKIGAEAQRTEGYGQYDRVTHEMLEDFDPGQLICSHSRVVTDRGIAVCPILLDSLGAIMGKTLSEASHDFPLAYGACFTCYQYGAICTNAASSPMES
jgi:sulfatase maturation enzyme AslB (radical SAM superfamily)